MLLNKLNKFINNIWHKPIIFAAQQPLLQQVEIEKLRHLAEKPISNSSHQHEVEHRQYGDMRSVYRGYGLDYEESRPYQTGDEMRFMNWRLSARSNELFMKVFREERRPSVFILVDRRQAMRFGSQSRLKVTQAARITAYLAFIAKRQNSPISGVILNEVTEWIPEASGETGVYNLLNQSNAACPPMTNETSDISLNHTLRLLLNMLIRGSIIYLVSDFHDLNASSHPLLLQLSEEHKLVAINISDSAERNLPQASSISIYNPDNNEDVYLDSRNERLSKHYHERAIGHFSNIENILSQYDIDYVEIDTETDNIDQKIPTA